MSENKGESKNKNAFNKKKKVKIYTKKKPKGTKEQSEITTLQEKYDSIDISAVQTFADLPLSTNTLKGLKNSGYTKPTEIQRDTIKLSLQGKDILGAAKTGSGKTLAFLIPILEALYCKQWTRLDGVGALVITPTRELAYQIFEALRRVGSEHDFSAGLIIGGKDLKFERNRMDQCNIVICTPGRLLQHMDENPLFNCDNMQVLVLDEADRCLDMGFAETMNSIIANLPAQRQTLLFSATQTKSVKDLARLSLKDPCYVSVHENSQYSTPSELQQSYVVCKLEDKLSILWSFVKNHLKQKVIIFFASCKQTKYFFEAFSKLRPGTSLMALYGTLHQLRRMDIYETFCRKSSAILFATDLASRGLDFPEVHWVVQADCPEDTATYIHRVGRTARYHRGGESLLLLLHSEIAMVDDLMKSKIPINQIEINPEKLKNPVRKIEAYLAKDMTLKDTAQRAFKSYVKAVYLMKNKNVFKVQELDTDSYAHSLGLAIPPRIRFLQKMNIKKPHVVPKNKIYFNSDESNDSGVSEEETEKPQPFQVQEDSDDDILMVKRKDHEIELPEGEEIADVAGSKKKKKPVTKAALAKKMLNKKIMPNKKIVFDEEGEALVEGTKHKRSELAKQYENEDEGGIDIEKAKIVLKEEDKFDKQLFKEKVKAKHREEKRKLKEQKKKKKDEDDEQDDFGTDSESDEPDLSWMPDPDKIYGEKDPADLDEFYNPDKSSNEEEVKKDEIDEEKISKKSKKRKSKGNDVSQSDDASKHLKKKKKLENVCSTLSVNEAEELAMMLLKNK